MVRVHGSRKILDLEVGIARRLALVETRPVEIGHDQLRSVPVDRRVHSPAAVEDVGARVAFEQIAVSFAMQDVVFLAAGGALLLSTALGVVGGAAIGTLVAGRTLRVVAALGFIAVGVWMLFQARAPA